jgi:hypothetical protein
MSSGDEGEDVTGSQAASASDQALAHLSAPGTISNSCLTSSTVIQHNAITAIKVGTATP